MTDAPDAVDETLINTIRRYTDPDNGISAAELADQVKPKETTVRDRVEEIVKAGYAPIANFGHGYFWITDEDQYQRERQKHLDTKLSKQARVEGLETAFNRGGPPTGRARPDGGQAAADVPQELADAVDALVREKGVGGAEADLQERFTSGEANERVTAALGYLRRHYTEVDG